MSIDRVSLQRREQWVSDEFTRVTTVIRMEGGGHAGVGEDVTYDPEDHGPLLSEGLPVDARGDWTFDELSDALAADLFPRPPSMEDARPFRRWGCESAALDLALRQAGLRLAEHLERAPRPVGFVASMRLEPPGSVERLLAMRARVPDVRFKLDALSEWDDRLVERIAAIGGVEIIDLKGMYEGTPVDQGPDPALYARVARAFPEALIEDPALGPETSSALGPDGLARVSWDAPVKSVSDVAALPATPAAINVKPSRIGSVRGLLEVYEALAADGVRAYGGGQMELGPGRGQIQLLASLFHPDGPNDVAPSEYNLPTLPPTLPGSPLPVSAGPGFSWEA